MSRAQGVDVDRNKVIGLAIANGIVAMAGALLAQYKGSANINDGRGAIVIGLAAIFIGLSVSMKIQLSNHRSIRLSIYNPHENTPPAWQEGYFIG